MTANDPSVGRYDFSVEGWSAVDKVAQFSHAVGRVSGGRGSAILIAVMDGQGQFVDFAPDPHAAHGGRGSSASRLTTPPSRETGSLRSNARHSRDSFRGAPHDSVNSLEQTPCEDDPRRAREMKQPPLGVLLTTSHVLCIPEEAEDATVTFLDQLGLMTAASLGHDPKPMRVPLRGAYGFVTSSAESNEHSMKYRRGIARCTGRRDSDSSPVSPPQDPNRDVPDYLLYRCQDISDEELAEEVGFTLTLCDIFPEPAETTTNSAVPLQPLSPLRRPRAAAAAGGVGMESSSRVSRGSSASSQRSFVQGRCLRHDSGCGASADTPHTATSRGGGGAASSKNTLLSIQPLPVPLLLSAIPDVTVGDAHLMITHVNAGQRCYRVQHVAAVYADYCEYKVASASEDECSGGPVFNSAGDFIGIQHERLGHSICLLMKSIVRNLFESDLLGMCRSPVSEVSAQESEPPGERDGEAEDAAPAVYSPKTSLRYSGASPRTSTLPETVGASPRTSALTTITATTAVSGGVSGHGGHYPSTASPTLTVKKPLPQKVPSYDAVFKEFYSGFDSLSHILYAFPYCRQLLKLALESLSQVKNGNELDQMSLIGGVGAILETIDGYPQDEAIVSGALAAMCRICINERNLVMFLHLDGVVSTMEIMKEYVHQPTVLQWGTYLLMSSTAASLASAARCAEVVVHSRGPQLFVNVLRVHGAVQRKSTMRHLQPNRLIRWTCDVIANLLLLDPQRTTLFLREDFLALLLQLLHDYARNMFLTEGLIHVFCVLVLCFSDADIESSRKLTDALPGIQVMRSASESKKPPLVGIEAAFWPSADQLVSAQLSLGSKASHFSQTNLASAHSPAIDPHEVSFFFLCHALAADTESGFLHGLLDICEATMDAKSSLTVHRGRPEGVLLRCFETLRLLLSWGLVRLRSRRDTSHAVPGAEDSFASLAGSHQMPSAMSSPLPIAAPSDELLRLRMILEKARATMPSAYALQTQLTAVEKLVRQQV
ncbi:hypothetical protein ABB37_00857 [Leptomonas pyrrhocoris]|uniref:Uncharacterized protein n=1 Tax=Leptomonas pyrrhocoris TaxID=157538 RepID=A0A0N0E0S8_LEPPY|nr:hypothetical protein ABB37_00857 [Leptomonas pyrrhocoris]KPA86791.1 hypothetical protein ABB37_00857 [Leptomonas pyrrhocoris]|eukprot:XP_015665230.1 hypothetical protein ABB37_00857 [Leptomonas pyrrhocoris]